MTDLTPILEQYVEAGFILVFAVGGYVNKDPNLIVHRKIIEARHSQKHKAWWVTKTDCFTTELKRTFKKKIKIPIVFVESKTGGASWSRKVDLRKDKEKDFVIWRNTPLGVVALGPKATGKALVIEFPEDSIHKEIGRFRVNLAGFRRGPGRGYFRLWRHCLDCTSDDWREKCYGVGLVSDIEYQRDFGYCAIDNVQQLDNDLRRAVECKSPSDSIDAFNNIQNRYCPDL